MKRVFINLDADESIFFSKELEAVKTQAYDVLYPEFKARKLIPVSFDAGPGAETIKYEQYDTVGMAKLIANYADDLPRADVKGKEYRVPVKSLGDSYGYNIQEVRASKMAKKPLEQRRANAAKRAMLMKENSIALLGDSATGLLGLLNHPNMPEYTLTADGTGSTKTWSTKTGIQINRDLSGIVSYVMTQTKGVENPDTILLPLAKFNYIANTKMDQGSDTTILQFFLKNNPQIKNIDWLNELAAAGAGGTDRMIVYTRSSEKLTLEIPQDFEQFPVQEKGLEFIVPCHQRIGGVIMYYPMAACFADGL